MSKGGLNAGATRSFCGEQRASSACSLPKMEVVDAQRPGQQLDLAHPANARQEIPRRAVEVAAHSCEQRFSVPATVAHQTPRCGRHEDADRRCFRFLHDAPSCHKPARCVIPHDGERRTNATRARQPRGQRLSGPVPRTDEPAAIKARRAGRACSDLPSNPASAGGTCQDREIIGPPRCFHRTILRKLKDHGLPGTILLSPQARRRSWGSRDTRKACLGRAEAGNLRP